jgi:hypothetical protein
LHAASSLHAFPNYLSYANELWGGPARTYKYLPNNDWGEAYYQAKEYLAQHPGEPCWLASGFLMDIRPYQLPCRQFFLASGGSPIPPHVDGTIILSSVYFDQPMALPNATNSWLTPFLQRPPDALLGGSAMLVFRGSFDTTAAAAETEYATAVGLAEKGQFDRGLQHALMAAIFAPANPNTRFEYCRQLVAVGARDMARFECRIARALLQEGETDFDSAAGISQAIRAESALEQGELASALTLARQGVEKAPRSSTAHRVYCRALQANREQDQANRECERSRELARSYPPKHGWMGPMPNVTRMGFNPGWGPARLKVVDLMLYALGER